jgi:1,4-alpha-glucan branching enzyme
LKQYFIGFLLFIIPHFILGQVVTSIPVYATENDSIIIFFDATQGNQGMMGYTGDDVYAHTGVITNNSTEPSDWKYVIADWKDNIPKARLIRVSTDLYKLTIGYPRSYYNMTDPTEKILQLAFVFRNSNGSVSGREVGGADIFHDLYDPGITVVIVEPEVNQNLGDPKRTPLFSNAADTIEIIATSATIGTEMLKMQLWINDVLKIDQEEDTIFHDFIAADYSDGYNVLTVVAQDTAGITDTSYLYILINPDVMEAAVPDGIVDGINYIDDNTVTLSLFAPYKNFVYVIGDFNDWLVETEYYMYRQTVNTDSVRFWLTIENLNAGQEYAFQYYVDGEIRLADPYTDKILDPWNDGDIPQSIYPGLKPYPTGKTEEIVSVFQTAQDPFDWVHSGTFQRPDKNKLVIYEMLLRDFLEQHDFQTLKDTLSYFKRLGINAIELMPFSEFEGNSSWGYNPSFYFAPDKYYGPKDDLKRLVDECHKEGIAVIQDIVLNHSYNQSVLARLYWNSEKNRPSAENPWYNEVSPNPVYSWGNDFNHESVATQAFVDRVIHYWITEYKIDGFRFDFTKGFTNTPGDGASYDAARIAILKRIADKIWETDTTIYVILEHFAPNTEEKELAEYRHGMMLWGNLNYNYNEATMGYHESNKSDFSWGYYGSRNWEDPHLVTYMESHDEERLMFKNVTYGNANQNYDVKDTTVAIDRMKMVFSFFLTYPGPKMVWQFGELGYDYSIDYDGRLGEKPIRWDYRNEKRRELLFKTVSSLLKLRTKNDVFTSPETNVELWLNDSNGKKRIRLFHSSMNVSIVGNFGLESQEINPSFVHPGIWYEFFSGDTLVISGGEQPTTLRPGEMRIYTDQWVEPPEEDLITYINQSFDAIPLTFGLSQNYPNPFNPSTAIRFNIPQSEHIQIYIYNTLGQKVRILMNWTMAAGNHEIIWDGRDDSGQVLSSGIYFLHFKAGDYVQNRRMLLMK